MMQVEAKFMGKYLRADVAHFSLGQLYIPRYMILSKNWNKKIIPSQMFVVAPFWKLSVYGH